MPEPMPGRTLGDAARKTPDRELIFGGKAPQCDGKLSQSACTIAQPQSPLTRPGKWFRRPGQGIVGS
ncbi:MAG: hypothetical protein IJ714_06375 [Bacteroidales bacterium]|nr:hypothetical protein [Bacteroidales bacterium]